MKNSVPKNDSYLQDALRWWRGCRQTVTYAAGSFLQTEKDLKAIETLALHLRFVRGRVLL